MIPAINSALDGLQRSSVKIGFAANDIVKAGIPTQDDGFAMPKNARVNLPSAFVDLSTATHSYKASLTVLLTVQEMSSVLLDLDRDEDPR